MPKHADDLHYINQGLFTAFVPVSKEGEQAWNELSSVTEGTGKVLTVQAKEFIYQLRKAGYTVTKAPKVKPLSADQLDSMLKELDGLI
jgi:hypothetical protein